mmetsp:Transcript_8537/g.9630  ORF Transcript_8537/g.9630 Transcript_8537/m.9630 type:complete len:84 (+) Transcript_8537:123-374(+)
MVSESDRLQLQRYGLIPVYVAGGLIAAVLVIIVIDRILRCKSRRVELVRHDSRKLQHDPQNVSSLSMKISMGSRTHPDYGSAT